MNYINLATKEYPYSLWQLRRDNPNVSFPATPTEDDIIPFGCRFVHPIPQPAFDPRTQQVIELPPEPDQGGAYQQRWQVVAASAEQIAAWDQANAPQPNWGAFKTAVMSHPAVNQSLADALALAPAAATALAPTLLACERGEMADFATAWAAVMSVAPLPVAAMGEMVALATANHLPAPFVQALQPPQTGPG